MSKIVGYSGAPLRMQRLGSFSPQLYRPVRVRRLAGLGADPTTNSQGHGFALGVGIGVVAGVLIGSLLRYA